MCFVTLGHDASSSTVTLSNQATDFNPLSIAFNLHRYCEQEQQQCQKQPQCLNNYINENCQYNIIGKGRFKKNMEIMGVFV